MTETSATVSYLYGVAALGDGLYDAVAPLRGVAGAAVRLVPDEDTGLAAVVSSVPAGDFEAAPLAAHLEDLGWLEAVARAHHHVIDAVAAAGAILPLRLATIYRDDGRVQALIRADRTAFARRLSRVDGRVEWGVKIYFEPPSAPAAPTTPAPSAGTSPGRAYLRSRHQERNARQDAFREAADAARNVDAAARAHAVAHARHRLQQGPLADDSGENIVNDAYLVPHDRADAFRHDVLSAAGQSDSIRVEITGPWAPYSFAATGLDEHGEKDQEVIT